MISHGFINLNSPLSGTHNQNIIPLKGKWGEPADQLILEKVVQIHEDGKKSQGDQESGPGKLHFTVKERKRRQNQKAKEYTFGQVPAVFRVKSKASAVLTGKGQDKEQNQGYEKKGVGISCEAWNPKRGRDQS